MLLDPVIGRPTVAQRQRPGITWEDMDAVLSRTSVFEMENDTLRPWQGPPGEGWRFWTQVWRRRQQQAPIVSFGDEDFELNECE